MPLSPRLGLFVVGPLFMSGCKRDQDFTELSRRLSTSLATFDAGIVPIEGRETLALFLAGLAAQLGPMPGAPGKNQEHRTQKHK